MSEATDELNVEEPEAPAEPDQAALPAEEAEKEAVSEPEVSPGMKPAISTGDLLIVGIIALILGVLICWPSISSSLSGGNEASDYDLSGGVAASVNGVEIGENDLTAFITSYRISQNLQSDEDWGQWMVDSGYTFEQLRSETAEYFISRELLAQALKDQGIEVSEDAVDAEVASIAEQVGGEDALKELLESSGMTLESYRENVLLSLQQEELAKKVSPEAAIDDARVLEVMKLYYPDEVPADATTLDGLDSESVDMIRSLLEESQREQALEDWMGQYREKVGVTINDMPEGLPYVIDLSSFEPSEYDLSALLDGSDVEYEVEDEEEAAQE